MFVRVHSDGTAIATGDDLPTQTVQASDDLYGTPVKDLEDGVYQVMPRRLKLTLRTGDLQSLTASEPGVGGAQEHVGPAFDWPALCRVVALDMGVPTRQVTRMKLRQVVPKLEDLLYRRGRSDIKRPQTTRHARKEGGPAEDDLVALLAETRQRCGHTLDVVAAKVGVDTATVFRWGKRTEVIASNHEASVRAYLDNPEKGDD